MKQRRQDFFALILALVLMLGLSACGGTVARFDPGLPSTPVDLAVTSMGDGQVSLSWPAVDNAAGYNVYFTTAPGPTRTSGARFTTTTSTSAVVTGLANDTTYFFVITAINANSESSESNVVSATPALPGSFSQADLVSGSQGQNVTWNFSILVSGEGAGWMRGNLSVGTEGQVTFNSFLDSAGNTTPPADLFPLLLMNPTGQVRDGNAEVAGFRGTMATRRNMIIGTSSRTGAPAMIAVLQVRDPNIPFAASDVFGFGTGGGGGGGGGGGANQRWFVYTQISTGSVQEWEFAEGQINSQGNVQYPTTAPFNIYAAPSNPVRPSSGATRFGKLSADPTDPAFGETIVGTPPVLPGVVISTAIMSDDKTVMVAVETDTTGVKHVLRIYQFVNLRSTTTEQNTLTLTDLLGDYGIRKLVVGTSFLSASGTLSIDGSGVTAFTSYIDSTGNSDLPPAFILSIDTANPQTGVLSKPADPSFNGKLSYFKDMIVTSQTDSSGVHSLAIGLK